MVELKLKFGEVKYQVLAVFCVNIIAFSHGCALGWLSPSLAFLKSEDSPLATGPITVFQASWIGSIFNVGSVLGNIIFGTIAHVYGRQFAIIFLAFPNFCFWFIVVFAQKIEYLYIGRILAGLTGGGSFVCLPLYIAEIAEKRIRGIFGASIVVSMNTGILFIYIVGSYVAYGIVPYIIAVFPIIFFCTFLFFPETPQFVLRKGKKEDAENSLKFYKNCRKDSNHDRINNELNDIQMYEKQKQENSTKIVLQDFCTPEARRGLFIGIMLLILWVFNGNFIFITYASQIFNDSGSDIDVNVSSIIVMLVQLIATCISTILVDIIGRRILIIVSTVGPTIGLTVFGLYSFLFKQGIDLTVFNWIPIAAISLNTFTSAIGINALALVILSEVLPAKIRATGFVICLSFYSLLLIAVLSLFPILSHFLELYTVIWSLAIVCAAGIVFSIFVIEETKGKNINSDSI